MSPAGRASPRSAPLLARSRSEDAAGRRGIVRGTRRFSCEARGETRVVEHQARLVVDEWFDSAFAVLDLGATGNEGDLRLRGDDGNFKIHLDGGRSLIVVSDTAGRRVLNFDGNNLCSILAVRATRVTCGSSATTEPSRSTSTLEAATSRSPGPTARRTSRRTARTRSGEERLHRALASDTAPAGGERLRRRGEPRVLLGAARPPTGSVPAPRETSFAGRDPAAPPRGRRGRADRRSRARPAFRARRAATRRA